MTPKHLNLYSWYPHREMNRAWLGRRLLCINWDIFRAIPIIKSNKTRNLVVWGLTGLRKPPNEKWRSQELTCTNETKNYYLGCPETTFPLGLFLSSVGRADHDWTQWEMTTMDTVPNDFGWTRFIGNAINNNNQIWESITFQHESIPYKTPPRTPSTRTVVTNICVGIH